jgi:predicted Zn-dependent protease with MMP-like domain
MAYRTSKEHFEELAEKALQAIPKKYRRYFRNLTIAVEDYPSREDADAVDVPMKELLGLFRGLPYSDKGGIFDIPASMPDTIVLYQKNIEAICSSERDLIEEIRATLIHEIGHYFGMSEEDLEQYE